MPPPRIQSLPSAKKTFVNREGPLKVFEDAAFAIPPGPAKLLVFHGIGGQGKTALCRELWRRTGDDPSYGFLRRAELDLHGRPKTDPDLLLVWIRNGFAKSGVAFPCFDLAFTIAWDATRGEQPLPQMDNGWVARHKEEIGETATDLISAVKKTLGDAAMGFPVFGALIRSVGGWAIKKGYETYLYRTREPIGELYRDGELKKPYELSELLPWMLAQDLNHHLAANPDDRFVLFIDEYERVFDEGGAGVRWKENPFDSHMRLLVQETNGLLATFFSRERLPWEDDPDWQDDVEGAQHLLGGLADVDADCFLRAVPILDEQIRRAMIEGARERAAPDAPIYALMLDLQVEHWRALVAAGKSVEPTDFRITAAEFEGRRKELVIRVLRDYGRELQATLMRLSHARRFDRAAFEHVVRTFHTGLTLDTFDVVAGLSFVSREDDGYLTIHGVVAEAIRETVHEKARRESLEAQFEHFAGRGLPASHREVTGATVAALFEAAYAKRNLSVEEYLAWLPSTTETLRIAARYADGEVLWREAVATAVAQLGPEHPETALALNNLGHFLQAQGDLRGAKPLHERALSIRQASLGPEHIETAASLNNLAVLLREEGNLSEAKPLYERALAIHEKVFGFQHPETALTLNNFGYLLSAQGDFRRARLVYERALAIRERVLGPEHPDTADSLNNLGSLLQTQGDLAGAKLLYERALKIREQALGPEHPDTTVSINCLGYLFRVQGDLAGARPLYERALAIREKMLGPEHPRTMTSLNNLGSLLQAQGDLTGAKPLFERALTISEKTRGEGHPDTARSLNNLGLLFDARGDLDGAKPLYERALAIWEALGLQHPEIAGTLNNLAKLLQAQGDLVGARRFYERALAIREKVLGPEHPDTAVILNNLGYLLAVNGDFAAARWLHNRALVVFERALGPEHSDTAWTIVLLGYIHEAQGDLTPAKEDYERALAIREKALGLEHFETAGSLSLLAGVLEKMGDPAAAKPLYKRALAIWEKALGPEHPKAKAARANLRRVGG